MSNNDQDVKKKQKGSWTNRRISKSKPKKKMLRNFKITCPLCGRKDCYGCDGHPEAWKA